MSKFANSLIIHIFADDKRCVFERSKRYFVNDSIYLKNEK